MSNIPQDGSTVNTHPIERILSNLKGVKSQRSNGRGNPGFVACCPSHDDQHPSLGIWEDGSDRAGLCCYAGCSQEAVLAAMGLDWHALYRDGQAREVPNDGIILFDLGADKLIHPNWLAQLGITDGHIDYKKRSVHIPVYLPDGTLYERHRIRTALAAKDGSAWSVGKAPAIPYGLERLDQARQSGYLPIVEGESDCWTLWAHGLPALGIPGARLYTSIKLEYLQGIDEIYIVQETDQAGKEFAAETFKHLQHIGYKGRVLLLDLGAFGAKDPNELHKKDIKAFKKTFETALLRARPLTKERAKPTVQRLRDLQQEVLPELRYAIEPILPEGATILAGKPKLGKSWLALAILNAISNGGEALGMYPVERGEVLYLALEEGKRRLQRRSNTLLREALASPDFYCATEWPRIDEGGKEELDMWIKEHPRARLICIDTWAQFKPKPRGRQITQYDEDYSGLVPLQKLAGEYGISILIVDHMRKMESEDPLDTVTGSTGKSGAVDGLLLLSRKRGESEARLFVTGRDIDFENERELLLTYNAECASWVVIKQESEDDSPAASTPTLQAILKELENYPEGIECVNLAKTLDKNPNTLRNQLSRLRRERSVIYKDAKWFLVQLNSKHSKDSKDSKLGENEQLTTGNSKIPYAVDTPVEPIQNNLTMLTTLTIAPANNSKKDPLPRWYDPTASDWAHYIETDRPGTTRESRLLDLVARRKKWHEQRGLSVPPLPDKWRVEVYRAQREQVAV